MSATEWTTAQAAEYWQVSEGRARSILADAGVEAVGREPGRRGRNLYRAADVQAVVRPGQGARTDLASRSGQVSTSSDAT